MNRSLGTCRWLGSAVILIVLALAGCGGSDAGAPSVASLVTASATKAAEVAEGTEAVGSAPAPVASDKAAGGAVGRDQRPQLRLDDSAADIDRKQAPYFSCLKANGHRMVEGRGPLSIDQQDDSAKAKAATKKCAGKLWRIPPETDPERNPHFADDFRAEIKCLNSRGVPVKAIDDEGSWSYTGESQLTQEKKEKVEKDCRLEAYGAKK
jgi:hypothetical protein